MAVRDFNELHLENFSHPHPVPKFMQTLKEWSGTGQHVLDVGCGSGFYTHFCQQLGNAAIGIDITSQVQAAHAQNLNVCLGNIEGHLPFPDKTFSLVLCIEVLEHLLQPELTLSEIRRVLRPGGALIVSTPNYAYWVLRLLFLFGRPPVGLPVQHYQGWFQRVKVNSPPPWQEPHIRFFTPAILRQFLRQAGFDLVELRSSFVAFPSGLAPYVPRLMGFPLRVIGKIIGNLDYLGDAYPSLLAAGLVAKAFKGK
jgi:SAM-dependent methyltransferase